MQLEQQLADVVGALGRRASGRDRARVPRISRASRLSISVQLVALPTMSVSGSPSCGASARASFSTHLARVVEQAVRLERQAAAVLLGDDRPRSRCARGPGRPSRPPRARSTRSRSRGSRRSCDRSAGSWCCFAQREKRRPANLGGARRGGSEQLLGEDARRAELDREIRERRDRRAGRPSQVGRVMIRSRRGTPF